MVLESCGGHVLALSLVGLIRINSMERITLHIVAVEIVLRMEAAPIAKIGAVLRHNE